MDRSVSGLNAAARLINSPARPAINAQRCNIKKKQRKKEEEKCASSNVTHATCTLCIMAIVQSSITRVLLYFFFSFYLFLADTRRALSIKLAKIAKVTQAR